MLFSLSLPRTGECRVASIRELKNHGSCSSRKHRRDRGTSVCQDVEVGKGKGESPNEMWQGVWMKRAASTRRQGWASSCGNCESPISRAYPGLVSRAGTRGHVLGAGGN